MYKLQFADVSMRYQGVVRTVEAIGDFSFAVYKSEAVSIIGPSGCGKSTVLYLAAGLRFPSTGSVTLDDHELTGPRERTSLILQDFGLMPWKTVEENAALGLMFRGEKKSVALSKGREALEHVGLVGTEKLYPSELSGGMRQRLALARSLALDTDLMLLDEPLSALDALLREDMQQTLFKLKQQHGYAQVLVTHSIEEALVLGEKVIVMSARPSHVVSVVDNPTYGLENQRLSPEFLQLSSQLRTLLANGETPHTGDDDA